MHSCRLTIFAGIVAATGGIGLTGFSYHRDPDLGRIALTLMLVGVISVAAALVAQCVLQTGRPAADAYEAGYQMGYDKGWNAAQHEEDGTVVPIISAG